MALLVGNCALDLLFKAKVYVSWIRDLLLSELLHIVIQVFAIKFKKQ